MKVYGGVELQLHIYKNFRVWLIISNFIRQKKSGKRITQHNNVGDKVQFEYRQQLTRIQTSASSCNWNLQLHQFWNFRLCSYGLWLRAVQYVVVKCNFGTYYLNFKGINRDGVTLKRLAHSKLHGVITQYTTIGILVNIPVTFILSLCQYFTNSKSLS